MHSKVCVVVPDDSEPEIRIRHFSLLKEQGLDVTPYGMHVAYGIHFNNGKKQMVLLANASAFRQIIGKLLVSFVHPPVDLLVKLN